MDRKPLPSERLQARLAAIQTNAAPSPDELASKFIAMAESAFADPLEVVGAKWTKQSDPFIFSRPAHDFSEYEAFVFKLAMVLGGLGSIGRDQAEILAATATYADGKAKVERLAPPLIGYQFPEYHHLQSDGAGNFIPKKLSEHSTEISALIQAHRDSPSEPLRTWIAKHVGSTPGAGTTGRSALLTDQPGPYTLPLGLLPNGNVLFYAGESSLLTVAPPGKGKTRCHVLPTLARYRGPALVLDIKGECYEHTAAWRRANVGPVLRFNPVEPENSACYNPLAFIDDDADELWESSRFLADLLVIIRSQTDSTWESQGKDLLTLVIAFVTAVYEPEERTMARVLDLVATIGLTEMLESVGTTESPFPSAMRRTAARYAKMAKNAPKQFEGILSGASQHLQVWEGPKVERVTSRADWSPEDFRSDPSPTLYLCVPPNAIDTYAPILRVIIGQHVRRLMRQHTGTATPILFLLDELPRLGQMQPIREALEVGRSYGIKLWMIAQYPEQLATAYPGVGEGMMEACDVRMYMNPSASTADRLAKAFGSSKNVLNNSSKPFLDATDILGPLHRDSIFVLAANETPTILKKRFFASS